jgi:hypothetical protein
MKIITAMTTIDDIRRSGVPESWDCIDCGTNTAPGFMNASQMLAAFDSNDGVATQHLDERAEVYTVKPEVWTAARMSPYGGCLCLGCIERRLGRTLRPKDFKRGNGLNETPGTDRLISRRMGMQLA